MADDKVVAFPSAQELPECPITIERPKASLCTHEKITLDTHQRVVRCSTCDQVFDAFSYLLSNAISITRAWSDYRSVRQRQQEKEASIEALARAERRLKERIKRLREKVEPSIDIMGKGKM